MASCSSNGMEHSKQSKAAAGALHHCYKSSFIVVVSSSTGTIVVQCKWVGCAIFKMGANCGRGLERGKDRTTKVKTNRVVENSEGQTTTSDQ
ncbi:hypothetical protein V6N13_112285 [Hibiscus sabdariffa]